MQSGRRQNLLTKWIYFLLKKGPPSPRRRHGPNKPPAAPTSYCSPAHARQSPGGGQTTYSLHSGGVLIQTAPALLLFHGAVFFCASRTTRSRGDQFLRAYARQKSSWLRCPVFAAPVAAGLQKADRCPSSASAASAAGSTSALQSLVSPFWTKFSTEPRTRPHGLAHSLR